MIRLEHEAPESYKAYVVREALTELGLIEPYPELPVEWKSLPFDELSVVTIPPLWGKPWYEARCNQTRVQAKRLSVGPEILLTVAVLPDRIVANWCQRNYYRHNDYRGYRVTIKQKRSSENGDIPRTELEGNDG